MEIKYCSNAIKVGTFRFSYDKNGEPRNEFIWEENFKKEMRKDKSTRVYIITSNSIIKKIGTSQDKGGIQNTLKIYENGGRGGRPSIRSYGIYKLINDELRDNKEVCVFYIKQKRIKVDIICLNSTKTCETNISPHDAERLCLEEYNNFEQSLNFKDSFYYPDWNFQEKNESWPDDIKEEHSDIIKMSLGTKLI